MSALPALGILMRRHSRPVEDFKCKLKIHIFTIFLWVRRFASEEKSWGFLKNKLGNHLGVIFPKIQKYEKDLNRVSARCLQEISDILDIPISFFFADSVQKEDNLCYYDNKISSKEEYFLLKNFRIFTCKKQRAILQLISDEKNSLLFS